MYIILLLHTNYNLKLAEFRSKSCVNSTWTDLRKIVARYAGNRSTRSKKKKKKKKKRRRRNFRREWNGSVVSKDTEAERRPWSSGDARFPFNPRLSRRARVIVIYEVFLRRSAITFITIPIFSRNRGAWALFCGRVIVGHVGVRGSSVRERSGCLAEDDTMTLERGEYDRELKIVGSLPNGINDRVLRLV